MYGQDTLQVQPDKAEPTHLLMAERLAGLLAQATSRT